MGYIFQAIFTKYPSQRYKLELIYIYLCPFGIIMIPRMEISGIFSILSYEL